ncbi:MAG: DedA family protein [Candidatus Zambryskibacteria bacterium]|nr:DedA family protein [Candidatus Zambryskibacteria bacterium]
MLIKTFGYIGLFVIVFAESGILLGFFLPGDSLLFAAGFLASQDYLDIKVILPLLFLAAFVGDSFGYFLGAKIGPKIFSRPKSFWFNPENVEKTRKFFNYYGAKAVVLARFIPVVRTFVPVMAGVGEMKYSHFLRYNFIGALLWVVGITLLGYLFGNTIPDADKYLLPVILLIVVVSFLPPLWHFYKRKKV